MADDGMELRDVPESATALVPGDNPSSGNAETSATAEAASAKNEGKQKEQVIAYQHAEKSMKEKYSDQIFTETYGQRIIYFGSKETRDLFLTIKAFMTQSDSPSIDAAYEKFAHHESGDALVKIVYSDEHVDYVIKYKYDKKYLAIRAAWEKNVLKAGLFLDHEPAVDEEEAFIKVYVPFTKLAEEAQQRQISIPLLKAETEPPPKLTFTQKVFRFFNPEDVVEPGASAPFDASKIHQFAGGIDFLHLCRGDEPIHQVKRNFFRRGLRNMLTYEILTHIMVLPDELKTIPNNHVPDKLSIGILAFLRRGIYMKFFPTHDGSHKSQQDSPNMRTYLKRNWALSYTKYQPLDAIRAYFGEKIAIYFAFLGYYTVWLWAASIAGLIVFIFGLVEAFNSPGLILPQRVSLLFDNALTIPWAVFISIWATIYLEFWKRKNAYLAWWWDVLDFEKEETTRPEWYGTKIRVSPITGEEEYHYPGKLRRVKMAVSCGLITLAVFIVLVSIMGSVVYQVWSRDQFGSCQLENPSLFETCKGGDSDEDFCADSCWAFNQTYCDSNITYTEFGGETFYLCKWNEEFSTCAPACESYTSQIPCLFTSLPDAASESDYRVGCAWADMFYRSQITAALINLLAIVVLNKFFEYIAGRLNDWENHKTQTQHEDSLIIKTFFFQFLNNYASLFYIAFFKGTVGQRSILGDPKLRDVCGYGSCFTELLVQLAIIFIGKQLIGQFQEVGLPWLLSIINAKQYERQTKAIEKKYSERREEAMKDGIQVGLNSKSVPQWVKDDRLNEFTTVLFDDYLEMALQFGFITLFVATFPLGPLFALINNLSEIRTDAYKLCTSYQRPPALRGQDIGSWENVLQGLGAMAVITNAFIVSFSSTWVQNRITEVYESQGYEVTDSLILAGRLLIVILFEHAVFGLKILCAYLVPDVPGPVQIAIDREKYLAKLALEGVADQNLLLHKKPKPEPPVPSDSNA